MSDRWKAGLAATKVRPPVLPVRLVHRSRLDEQLDAGIARHARLVLVSAPAGSGKSTLLASWLASRPEAVAWLQAEESDADPARFWSYLVEAIGQAHPIATGDLRELIRGSNGDALVVVPALVNRLAEVAAPVLVVVDDYHVVDNVDVHRGVERLIDLCPPQVTIVLSTRIDPPFRLGRLRVRNQIAEVRAADLRFASGEAPGLLGPGGPDLDAALVEQLCGRTEGWAAGLVLAGLSMQRAADPVEFVEAFRGDDTLVVDYLRDELLVAVDHADRERLLETSILEQLNADLVDAVTGRPGGSDWLTGIAGANQLVIRLDRTDTWFRYHHLLRDLLRLEAEQRIKDRLPSLHGRAAAWFEAQGDLREAIDHRLAAGEVAEAVRLVRLHGPELLRAGQVDTLRGLLERFGDVARTSTACAVLFGWCELIGGRYSLAESWVETALEVAPEGLDVTAIGSLRINISVGRGDVASALDLARHLTATNQLIAHPSDLATAAGGAYAWAGQADQARTALGIAVERAADEGHRTAHVLALVYLAVVAFDADGVEPARVAASAAIDAAGRFGLGEYYGVAPAYAIRARTGVDRATVLADAALAVPLARRASTDLARAFVLTVCGDTRNDLEGGSGNELLAEARSIIDRCTDPGVAGRHLARAESRHGLAARAARAEALVEQLTDREVAVLRYLPSGLSQRAIAGELYVSLNTVKTHCRAIYRKLGVGERHAAVQAARDLHLL